MMSFVRKHWYDAGFILSLIVGVYLMFNWKQNSTVQNLLWLNLISLLLHQFEEYRFPGNFPQMMNKVVFSSQKPDRYPLNAQSALIINVIVGWIPYFLAAIYGETILWLGMATIIGSFGNSIAHILIFNIKGKSWYNPGMLSCVIFFLPVSIIFIHTVMDYHILKIWDWIISITLGIILAAAGIFKTIDRFKDLETGYIFKSK